MAVGQSPSNLLRDLDKVTSFLHSFFSYVPIPCPSLFRKQNVQDWSKGLRLAEMGVHSLTSYLLMTPWFSFWKDNKSLANLQRILDWYCSLSGQCINLSKSDLFCSPNMPRDDQESLSRNLQVNLVQNPSKYLGLNFKLRGNQVANFQFLVDKLNSKIQGWKTKLLS